MYEHADPTCTDTTRQTERSRRVARNRKLMLTIIDDTFHAIWLEAMRHENEMGMGR